MRYKRRGLVFRLFGSLDDPKMRELFGVFRYLSDLGYEEFVRPSSMRNGGDLELELVEGSRFKGLYEIVALLEEVTGESRLLDRSREYGRLYPCHLELMMPVAS